jgi:hypothetical protein
MVEVIKSSSPNPRLPLTDLRLPLSGKPFGVPSLGVRIGGTL